MSTSHGVKSHNFDLKELCYEKSSHIWKKSGKEEQTSDILLCFHVSQQFVSSLVFRAQSPQGIISGLKETFIKRHTVERTNKAETRPEEQSQKT